MGAVAPKTKKADFISNTFITLTIYDITNLCKIFGRYINKIQQYARLGRYLLTAKSLYMFRQQPSSNVAYRPRWRKVVAQILWPVPEDAVTVLCTPDDGCDGHPKHVEWFCSK